MMKFLLFIIGVFAISTQIVSGQSTDTLTVDLEAVRIEAARIASFEDRAPFAFISRDIRIERRITTPAPTLMDPFRAIPGVWVNDRNNNAIGERISVRGMGWRASFGVRGIYVLMDGVPLTMPDGQAITSLTDPGFISNVELIRGPSSSFWGNGGGGTILMNTASFRDETYVRTRFTTGSFGYYKIDFETAFNSGSNRFMIYGSNQISDGFRDYSRFEAWRFGGHADIELTNNSRLHLTTAILESPVSDNPGSLTLEQFQESPDIANPNNVRQQAAKFTTHGQFGATYSYFLPDGKITVNSWGLNRQLENPLAFAWIQLDRLAGGVRTSYELNASDFDWGIGIDASMQSDNRKNWVNEEGEQGNITLDQREQVANLAAFSRIQIPLGAFSISGGVRADWIDFRNFDQLQRVEDTSGSRNFFSVSPMIGIGYNWNQNYIYANFSSGFETPTTTELVNRPDMDGGFNPDLQPEKSFSGEIGVRSSAIPGLLVDAAFFNTWVTDFLSSFRTEEGGDRDFYRNLGATRFTGFEIMAETSPFNGLSLTLNYGYNYFIFDDDSIVAAGESVKGNRIPGIPDHRFSGMLQYFNRGFRLMVEADYSASYFVNNQNSVQNPSYVVFNTNISFIELSLGNNLYVTPFFQLNNIFDELYSGSVIINAFGGRYYEPSPGRNWQAGINVSFGR